MKQNNKIILKKDECRSISRRYTGKALWPIILSSILFVICLAVVILCAFGIAVENSVQRYIGVAIGGAFALSFLLFTIFYYALKGKKIKKTTPLIVKEEKEDYKIVDEISTDILTEDEVQGFIKDIKNPEKKIEYKEEVIEKQTNENIAYVTTFNEFSFFINQYFLHKGYKTEIGNELVASLVTCPLIFLRSKQDITPFIDNINGCFNAPKLVCDASKCNTIADDHVFFDAINAARSLKDEEIFLVIKNMLPEEIHYFLRPLEDLVFNQSKNAVIKLPNNEIKIPKNLFVVCALEDDSKFFEIDKNILAKGTIINFEYQEVEVEETIAKPLDLSQINVTYTLNTLKNSCFLDEMYWKNIDAIEELFIKAGKYHFDNKILLRIEGYTSLLINNTDNQMEALDSALSNLILVPALKFSDREKLENDQNIRVLFNTLFAETDMTKSRNIIEEFLNANFEEGK